MDWSALALAAGAVVAGWLVLVAVLWAAGRRADAAALARLVPDLLVLVRRLAADRRVPRRHRWLLGLTLVYLAVPFDVVPDVIPVAGQLDDALVVALVLRGVLCAAGPSVVREHWSGPERSLAALLRLAGG